MTIQHRIAIAMTAAALMFGIGFSPASAMDSMSKGAMHKHMKKHKGMMKGDAMKSDEMSK